jgi:hypothetical protein
MEKKGRKLVINRQTFDFLFADKEEVAVAGSADGGNYYVADRGRFYCKRAA